MTTLAQARKAIADQLRAAGLHAFDHVPEVITPPAVFVAPGEPYLTKETDRTLMRGEVLASFDVVLLGPAKVNAEVADQLDALIATALAALWFDGTAGEVSAYGQTSINAQPFTACAIRAERIVNLPNPTP